MNAAEVPIANPCTVGWTTMTLADRGRFCGQCRKVVRELAQMSEREARALLASPPTEGLCVRYLYDAKGEIVFRQDGVVPVARLARKVATAALAIALPLAAAACSATGEPMTVTPPETANDVMPMMGAPPPPPPAPDAGAPGTAVDQAK
jgi:hypothetical protein